MKVLFDHSVIQHGLRGEHKVVYPNGRRAEHNDLMVFEHRIFPSKDVWLQSQINCLAAIADLCRQGKIVAYTTEELRAEQWRALKFPSQVYDDTFRELDFNLAQSPLERSKWGLDSDQYASKDQVIAYCKCFLLSPTEARMEKFIAGMRKNPTFSLTDFEEKCLRNISLFKAICHGIAETHYPDALHLWTAEENQLDVFLTTDKKFQNVIKNQNVNLNCKVLLPREVLGVCSEI